MNPRIARRLNHKQIKPGWTGAGFVINGGIHVRDVLHVDEELQQYEGLYVRAFHNGERVEIKVGQTSKSVADRVKRHYEAMGVPYSEDARTAEVEEE